ncbi:MAG: hypothetical protein ABSA26_11550 [Thermoguttaceae bacterium]
MHRVLNDVQSIYYEVLYAQQTIEINEQLVRNKNCGEFVRRQGSESC